MKLLDSIYTIKETADSAFIIGLDAEHFIYKAHFPGEPITPGVVILQISLELLEILTGRDLQLSQVKNVKFLKIISPTDIPFLTYSYSKVIEENGEVRAQVVVSSEQDIFAKLSISCRIL